MGGPAAQDDATIDDAERLLRRVHPVHVVYDQNRQVWRASSAAFEDVYDGVSVFLRSILDEHELTESDVLIGYDKHSLVVFTAGAVRGMTPPLGVVRDPNPPGVTPHLCSPAHALVTGIAPGKPGKRQSRKPLAERVASTFVVARPPITP